MKSKTEEILKNPFAVAAVALLCCALWGSAFPCIKVGYQLFSIESQDSITQILFAGLRFTLAGIFTIVIGSIMNRRFLKPKREHLYMIRNLALTQTIIQYFFFYIGLAHTAGSKSSIIDAAGVFFTVLVSAVLFHQETLTGKKLAGCLIGFAGVVLINLNGIGDFSMTFLGEGFILLCSVSGAFASVLIKAYSKEELPFTLSGYQFVVGGLVMTVVGFLLGGRFGSISFSGILLLLYLAMVSAVAYSMWGMLLKYNPVSRVTVYGFSKPIWGVLLSALLLQENQTLGIMGIFSLVCVCVGIYLVNRFS